MKCHESASHVTRVLLRLRLVQVLTVRTRYYLYKHTFVMQVQGTLRATYYVLRTTGRPTVINTLALGASIHAMQSCMAYYNALEVQVPIKLLLTKRKRRASSTSCRDLLLVQNSEYK